jgi:hypothetical protein
MRQRDHADHYDRHDYEHSDAAGGPPCGPANAVLTLRFPGKPPFVPLPGKLALALLLTRHPPSPPVINR